MKLIGILILILELLALALQIKSECNKNNFTFASIKEFLYSLINKLKSEPKLKPKHNFLQRKNKK